MEIFAEALKILAADVLLFGVISTVGLLTVLWLAFGNKPLQKCILNSLPLIETKLNGALRVFLFAFIAILIYLIGASFRAAADEWIGAKPKWHLNLKHVWLLKDYPYAQQKKSSEEIPATQKNREIFLQKALNDEGLKEKVEQEYIKDAKKHTDKALKLYALAELVKHAEHAASNVVNSTLACRLKMYKASLLKDVPQAAFCATGKTAVNEDYEAIEEVSGFYHAVKQLQIVKECCGQTKYDSTGSRTDLVIDFLRLAALLFFALAIAAVLAILRRAIVCPPGINPKRWRPGIRAVWAVAILFTSLLGYLGSAAAWQALEIHNNKVLFRKYFAGGYPEKKEKVLNPMLSALDIELRDLGLLINITTPNAGE